MKHKKSIGVCSCRRNDYVAKLCICSCSIWGETLTTGDSIVENDNSTRPDVKDVVLPVLDAKIYDFMIDREA